MKENNHTQYCSLALKGEATEPYRFHDTGRCADSRETQLGNMSFFFIKQQQGTICSHGASDASAGIDDLTTASPTSMVMPGPIAISTTLSPAINIEGFAECSSSSLS